MECSKADRKRATQTAAKFFYRLFFTGLAAIGLLVIVVVELTKLQFDATGLHGHSRTQANFSVEQKISQFSWQ